MAGGWRRDGAVRDQIVDPIANVVLSARAGVPTAAIVVTQPHAVGGEEKGASRFRQRGDAGR